MNQYNLPFKITPMTLVDIPQAIAIEQLAYASTYPSRDYVKELNHNQLAHYFILHTQFLHPQINESSFSDASNMSTVGVGGFWLMTSELHIMTLALHPDWQGLGLGEWLLVTLLKQGQTRDAQIATLEVRPSNCTAISLYQKYSFQEVGRRPNYYRNNGEDALIFTTPLSHLPDYQAMMTE